MKSIESDLGAGDCGGGEEGLDEGSDGIKIWEAALLIGERLLLAVADDIDGEIVDIITLEGIGGDAGYGGLGCTSAGDITWIGADGNLVVGGVGAEANTFDVKGGSSTHTARRLDDRAGRTRDWVKLKCLVPYRGE